MKRIKVIIKLPKRIEASFNEETRELTIIGPRGKVTRGILRDMKVKILPVDRKIEIRYGLFKKVKIIKENSFYTTEHNNDLKKSIIKDIKEVIRGVIKGYNDKLKLCGIGVNVIIKDKKLTLRVKDKIKGEYLIEDRTRIQLIDEHILDIKTNDKEKLIETMNKLVNLRGKCFYSLKGIYYIDETVVFKGGISFDLSDKYK